MGSESGLGDGIWILTPAAISKNLSAHKGFKKAKDKKALINRLLAGESVDVPEKTRLHDVYTWLIGDDEGGLILVDECHKVKNLGKIYCISLGAFFS